MSHNDLPEFKSQKMHIVMPLMTRIFTRKDTTSGNFFIKLEQYPDNHFRVIFKSTYFVLQGDQTEPSISQWRTLKKKIKRNNHHIFIFKETGFVDCVTVKHNLPTSPNFKCNYIDFGYFRH